MDRLNKRIVADDLEINFKLKVKKNTGNDHALLPKLLLTIFQRLFIVVLFLIGVYLKKSYMLKFYPTLTVLLNH